MQPLRRFHPLLLVVGLTVLGSPGRSQAFKLTPPASFRFEGDWQCSGRFPRSGKTHRSSYHGAANADGRWIVLTETDIEPKGYVGIYELGADAGGTKLIFLDVNSAGYAIFDSPGWQGQTLTVTSTEVHYAKVFPQNRFIYTVKDAQHFDVEWQVEKDNAWASGDSLHCSAQGPGTDVSYFLPDVHEGETYNTVFSRTISFKGESMDELVHRVSGTASTVVTKVQPDDIEMNDTYRYDGMQAGEGTDQRKDSGRINCFNGQCQTATDGSGTFFNALLWGQPPDNIRPGVSWSIHIDVPWELGPPGEQIVTVISADPTTGTVLLKREGSGDGFFDHDLKQVSITRAGKTYKVAVAPGRARWSGQTIFRRGVVLSDELMMERPVTLSSVEFGKSSATERQYILLNAAPSRKEPQ